ncbi:CocE/NonD family hydrolase, partial [uncultured Maricaulis sp.]|uniref:alpha/beta hydrolase n=1 Tax=uncultured Maricaulis sp. TaxID=174710 RepID=UPI0030D80019
MPDVIIPGPAGRLEGRYSPSEDPTAPIALILHAHPLGGGHMENPSAEMMYDVFRKRGFATLRFNFRGVGRSQGSYDQGLGGPSEASNFLDWVQGYNQGPRFFWLTGHSFGARVGLHLFIILTRTSGCVSVHP